MINSRDPQTLMVKNRIVKHYAGSLAYGTALPTSDIDFRGIFCADPINVLTPFYPIRECTDSTEEDTKYYELSHFLKLCLECNPNIVETLWVEDPCIVHSSSAYELLRANRQKFLSSKIAFTTSGYALAQLKRIKGHNKWINSPQPEQPPQPKNFISLIQNFGNAKIFPGAFNLVRNGYRLIPYGGNIFGVYPQVGYQTYDDDGSLNTIYEGDHQTIGSPEMIVKFNKAEYKQAKEKHQLYWNWKKNRNESRSVLEEQHGFDTKHAMHLVRLLRMGVEALRDGVILVQRPDADELLSIRNGAWTYKEIIEYADMMDNDIRTHWYKTTELPRQPDIKFAANILMEVQESIWNNESKR